MALVAPNFHICAPCLLDNTNALNESSPFLEVPYEDLLPTTHSLAAAADLQQSNGGGGGGGGGGGSSNAEGDRARRLWGDILEFLFVSREDVPLLGSTYEKEIVKSHDQVIANYKEVRHALTTFAGGKFLHLLDPKPEQGEQQQQQQQQQQQEEGEREATAGTASGGGAAAGNQYAHSHIHFYQQQQQHHHHHAPPGIAPAAALGPVFASS